jgi:hypothetical protein
MDCKAAGTAGNWTKESGRHAGVTLTDAVVRGLMMPTPRSSECRSPSTTERHPSIVGMGKRLATPTASDCKRATAAPSQKGRSLSGDMMPGGALGLDATTGSESQRLSPSFVEWMMGFPIGWTEIGASGSTRSATG